MCAACEIVYAGNGNREGRMYIRAMYFYARPHMLPSIERHAGRVLLFMVTHATTITQLDRLCPYHARVSPLSTPLIPATRRHGSTPPCV